ncbi:MAG TPA: competence/damage-inducible protein A [Clostridiaceae bacterium]|nr:competence/damage-inducible protein A [Clostridiaceae bacterium]
MDLFRVALPNPEQEITKAEIVSIGTELLLGQTLNTDARDLARELSELGINCYYQSVVGDNPERMEEVIRLSLKRSDLVITTGGLGPTEDDITMGVCAKIAGSELVYHAESERRIKEFFAIRGLVPSDKSKKQVMLPSDAYIMPNDAGTAPGAVFNFEYNGQTRYLAVLPGPPMEMNLMFQRELKPWLKRYSRHHLHHQYIRTVGIGESQLVAKITDIIHNQGLVSIAPYASAGEVMLRLSVMAPHDMPIDEVNALIQPVAEQIKERIDEYIYSEDNKPMAEVVLSLLTKEKAMVGFAESCTAGLAAAELAKIPGASRVLSGGVITYCNELKHSLLGVSREILAREGAVSESCAIAMAVGARSLLKTDYAVSITGIAGPEGGSEVKPVGTVWIGISHRNGSFARSFLFAGDRNHIRKVSVLNALDLLRRCLLSRE